MRARAVFLFFCDKIFKIYFRCHTYMLFKQSVAVGYIGYADTSAGIIEGYVSCFFDFDKHMYFFSCYILTD